LLDGVSHVSGIANFDFFHLYNDRGLAYSANNEVDQAISDYDQAIALAPDEAMHYVNRGFAYEKTDRVEQRIQAQPTLNRFTPRNNMARRQQEVLSNVVF